MSSDVEILLQLEMYQPQQQQQSGVTVLYTAAGQPVTFTSASQVCESYRSRQSMVAGFILIITGVLSVVLNGVGLSRIEIFSHIGHGIWCGVMVGEICCKLKLCI